MRCQRGAYPVGWPARAARRESVLPLCASSHTSILCTTPAKTNLPFLHSSGWVKFHRHSHCSFLRNGVFFPVAPHSLVFLSTGWLGDTSTRLPAWRAGT